MIGAIRREKLLECLQGQNPISGTVLAKKFCVSRQVIVQDIALLRAEHKNILSTNKGYLLHNSQSQDGYQRMFRVRHTTEELQSELICIVELGGHILDVCVDHELYGLIRANLNIRTKDDVTAFVARLSAAGGMPLKILTNDYHYHTVAASTARLLDVIELELSTLGFLAT